MTTNPADRPDAPLLFVTVGTDVHRFDRLIDWTEQWSAAHPDVHCIVQYGMSRTPAQGTAHELLPLTEVLDLMRRSTVVVTQGGPGSILDCRDSGHVPIVVPRRVDLGEHVDNHQLAFTARMERDGYLVRATTKAEFDAALDAAFADPDRLRIPPADPDVVPPAVERFGAEVEALVASRKNSGKRRRFFR